MKLNLAILIVFVTFTSALQAQTTCVVVVDPQAQSEGYGYYDGYNEGWYYSQHLGMVAKQELEVVLKKLGFLVLVNAHEVGENQEELRLENSEWGELGNGRNDIGYFTGADETWLVSAFTYGARDLDIEASIDGTGVSVEMSDMTVKVIIRRTSTRTREIPEIYEGTSRKKLFKGVQAGTGWLRLASEIVSAGIASWQDAGRAATRGALEKALRDVEAPQNLFPAEEEIGATPRFIYLALRADVEEGEHFAIFRAGQAVAEVQVVRVQRDGRAKCRIIDSRVDDLGKRGDTARSLTPTIPVE